MSIKTWTVFNFISIVFFSLILYVLFVITSDVFAFSGTYYSARQLIDSPVFYIYLIMAAFTVLSIEIIKLAFIKEFLIPLSVLFNSIVRRGKEKEQKVFDDMVEQIEDLKINDQKSKNEKSKGT